VVEFVIETRKESCKEFPLSGLCPSSYQHTNRWSVIDASF